VAFFHLHLAGKTSCQVFEMAEPLYIRCDAEPLEVDPSDCNTVAQLIDKAEKRFSPQLDELAPAYLTLHRYSGLKLKPGLKLSTLLAEKKFENSDDFPLLLRYAEEILPVVQKKTHHSEDRKRRWDELNPILIN
jgi:hypothetical protein